MKREKRREEIQMKIEKRKKRRSAAILAQGPFLVRTCTVFFPVHDCLLQVSATQFCCFPPVLMARASGCACFSLAWLLFEYGFS